MNKSFQKNRLGNRIIDIIVQRSQRIEIVFIALLIISACCFPFVGVNYDLSKYLPEDMPSKQGIALMEQEFGYPGTARLMLSEVSIYEAKLYKDLFENIDGVDMITWADFAANLYGAQSFLRENELGGYYHDNCALMNIIFTEGDSGAQTHAALNEIKSIGGDKVSLAGPAVQTQFLNKSLLREMAVVLVIGILIILLLLFLSTTFWFAPLLFLLVIFVSLVINMGSNIIFGTISSLTFSVAAVLQLAMSMDYTIILLDNFMKERKQDLTVEQAMANALRNSLVPILSAGSTTVVGMLALLLMQFNIGRDMGLVLAKGIAISMISVILLMPALTLRWHSLIDRSAHRPFTPSFRPAARMIYRLRWAVLILALIITPVAYVGKDLSLFSFSSEAMSSSPGTAVYDEVVAINREFGRSNTVMIIVPNESIITEKRLATCLSDLDYAQSVTSLALMVPDGIPLSFLPPSTTEMMHTEGYARIIFSIRTAVESELAFACLDEIKSIVKSLYPENSYVVGLTASAMDVKSVIVDDFTSITWISWLGVFLAILIAFRSWLLPAVLMIPILIAIFTNMLMPYLLNHEIMYIGYIIVSCMQLGATIDYSILMTHHYLHYRNNMDAKSASIEATAASMLPILTSGLILSLSAYALYFSSSVTAIADLGRLVGRGALFSMFWVIMLLPCLLILSDRLVFRRKPSHPQQSPLNQNTIEATSGLDEGH